MLRDFLEIMQLVGGRTVVSIWVKGKLNVSWYRRLWLSEFVKLCCSNKDPQILQKWELQSRSCWELHGGHSGPSPCAFSFWDTSWEGAAHSWDIVFSWQREKNKRQSQAMWLPLKLLCHIHSYSIGQSESHSQAWKRGREVSPVVTCQWMGMFGSPTGKAVDGNINIINHSFQKAKKWFHKP